MPASIEVPMSSALTPSTPSSGLPSIFYVQKSGPRATVSYINGQQAPQTNYGEIERFIRALAPYSPLIVPFYVDAVASKEAKKALPTHDPSLPFDLVLFNGKNVGLVVAGVHCNVKDLDNIVEALIQAGWAKGELH